MNFIRLGASAALCVATWASVSGAVAQSPDWRALARGDLDGARAAIVANHPGAAPELGDADFIDAERRGYEAALGLIERVDSAGGYRAVLSAYAVAFADPHIGVRFSGPPPALRWPGFMVSRRGGEFVVSTSQVAALEVGDVVDQCDGRLVEDFALSSLGRFETDWSVEAQRINRAPLLFVDMGNPFVAYPRQCTFRRGSALNSHDLAWRAVEATRLNSAIRRPQRTFDVRDLPGGGVWITLPQLNAAAAAFVDSLAQRVEALRSAAFVVIDVRGNSGGNSRIGDRLADLLAVPRAVLPRSTAPASAHWRTSEGNAANVASYADMPQFSAEERTSFTAQANQIRDAMRAGVAFAPPLPAVLPTYPQTPAPAASPRTARFLILTDYVCTSSCLIMVDRFRFSGAAQIGAETSYTTRYMEVRSVRLPSGLATLSLLQKVALARPDRFGPFRPVVHFSGDLDNDAAVESWVLSLRN